jgi:hypothetical protein
MRMSSSSLPQPTAHFSDGTRLVLCSRSPPEPRRAVCALLKTCNQLRGNHRRVPKSLSRVFQVSCGTGEPDAIEGAGRMQPRDRCSNSVIRRAARLPSPISITDQTVPGPSHHRDHTDLIETHHRGYPDFCLVCYGVVLGRRLIVFGLSRPPPDSMDGCYKERDRNNIH